jgi:hypothetical protein
MSIIQRVASSFTLVCFVFAAIITALILYYYLNCWSSVATGLASRSSYSSPFGYGIGAFYLSNQYASLPFVAAAALLWFL